MTYFTSAPEDLPIEDLRIDIALDWSAAQALAAYEWLEQMRSRIWLLYGEEIVRLLRDDATTTGAPPSAHDDPLL